ncbi:glutaredoxin-like protein NrdH [Aerococcaceae bacterium NML190073]|nr:glutaredoxin-like protein NrdH [Aerococcaceae bacterium NML190073]
MSEIKVYSKPNCMQCDFTKKWLQDNGVMYEELDVEKQPTALEEVIALGYKSLPVVYVDSDNHWFGFRPHRLEGLLHG